MIIFHVSALPGTELQENGFYVNVPNPETEKLFKALKQYDLTVITAAGHDMEEVLREILAEHREISPQDTLYVDTDLSRFRAMEHLGVAGCFMLIFGASKITLKERVLRLWRAYAYREILLIVGAQQPAY